MNSIFQQSNTPTRTKNHMILQGLQFIILLFTLALLPFFNACSPKIDYFDYVSERRSNVLLYSGNNYHVTIHDVEREYPYVADGYVGEATHRVELFITAPEGTTHCHVQFFVDGKTHGGEASFDSVKREYYYSCNEDVSTLFSLPLRLQFGDTVYEATASSVRTAKSISPQQALTFVVEEAPDLFAAMCNKHSFLGELYVRLLYEDAPYYYVGVVDRNGNITAFLLDAETGKILARRNP